MNYDFIEIGTADFDTLTQTADDKTRGLAVDPLGHFLERLPSPPQVRKLCVAISPDNICGSANMHWIPEHVIAAKKLPEWLRGCNSLNKPHPQHVALNLLGDMVVTQVPLLPISHLWVMNLVAEVGILKLDTEGCDADILVHLHSHLYFNRLKWPRKIVFEANTLTDIEKVRHVIRLYTWTGYNCQHSGHDVTMSLR